MRNIIQYILQSEIVTTHEGEEIIFLKSNYKYK
jgi:hypothetical protein